MFNNFKSDLKKIDETNLINELKNIFKFLIAESSNVTSFVGYDIGLGDIKSTKKDNNLTYGKNFQLGVLNQGLFQTTVFNESQWTQMREYIKNNKNISKINLFFCSSSLLSSKSPLLATLPILNLFQTGIGMQFVDKDNKIIRNALFQLNFGESDGTTGDIVDRFLTPEFSMSPVIEENKVKNPLNFTDKEFSNNLFIDYTKSISAIMGNFLEMEDYVADNLIKNIGCLDSSNLKNTSPVPFEDFARQNYTLNDFFNAYYTYKNSSNNIGGPADGVIFELCGFGPSPFSNNSGNIIHFATCNDKNDIIKIIDFVFTNYNGCSSDITNSNQFFSLIGIDKVTPIESLNKKEIKNLLLKPNITSTENGFIREMLGRPTHSNTFSAVLITLVDELASENSKNWTLYTDWTNKDLEENNFYMINPVVINIPVVEFPTGWEYGVNLKDLNNNPIYTEDKKQFYKFMFFLRSVLNGFSTIGKNVILTDTSINQASPYEKIFYLISNIIDNKIVENIFKTIFTDSSSYSYTNSLLKILFILYIIVILNLTDHIYLPTGQSVVDKNGVNLNITDPYPCIWKINVQKNGPVLLAYIENFLYSFSNNYNFKNKSAGNIYYDTKNNYNIYDLFNQLNRWIHPFPMNKFFLWFPGIKWNNNCDKIKLPNEIVFYQPQISYKLVDKNQSYNLSLSKWGKNKDKKDIKQKKSFDNRIYLTLLITILIIIFIVTIYYLIYNNRDRKNF